MRHLNFTISNVKLASSASFSTGSGGPSDRAPCVVRPRTGEVLRPRVFTLALAIARLPVAVLPPALRPAEATEAPATEVMLWARVWREWCDCEEGEVGAAVVLRVSGERERLLLVEFVTEIEKSVSVK